MLRHVETAQRGFEEWSSICLASQCLGHDGTVPYFGDFDLSGEDTVRSLRERLVDLGSRPENTKSALVVEHIGRYRRPPDFHYGNRHPPIGLSCEMG